MLQLERQNIRKEKNHHADIRLPGLQHKFIHFPVSLTLIQNNTDVMNKETRESSYQNKLKKYRQRSSYTKCKHNTM